jgi:polysaccharide biosynthesis/export protein PslD
MPTAMKASLDASDRRQAGAPGAPMTFARCRAGIGSSRARANSNGIGFAGMLMRLTSWLGLEQVGRKPGGGCSRRLLFRAALALLPSMLLTACEAVRPFERSADGSLVYLDQRTPAQKEAARAAVVRALKQGTPVYNLQAGDKFEVYFDIERQTTPSSYLIRAGDKLRVDFLDTTQASGEVLVRPDGRISMPLIGAVEAAGTTVSALTRELEVRYASVLTKPQITVNLTETHSPLDEFIRTIGSANQSRSITDTVLPDGTISLPLLHPIEARGRTLDQLRRAIDAGYRSRGLDVSVSLVARKLLPGTAMVLGEVERPGAIALDRPHTVLMAVAQAGGVLRDGSLKDVRVFYIGKDGAPRVRAINLEEEIDGLKLEDDMILPSNSIIYVPTTALAKTGRLLDQVLRDILRYQGFSIGGTFIMNTQPSGGTVVIPSP